MYCSYCGKQIVRNLTMKELLFPFCLPKNELCTDCKQKFHPLHPGCATCQKEGITGICSECKRWQNLYPDYDFKQVALFKYDEGFADWIENYKYLGNYELRHTFAPLVKKTMRQYADAIICPIPLSKEKQEIRGFNQVEGVLEAANISYECLLQKIIDTPAQAKKTREERLLMPQVFKVVEALPDLKNKEIVLVDDVYTTGRTLFYAAECLLPFHPKKIRTFTLAR